MHQQPSNEAVRNAVTNRMEWGIHALKALVAIDSVAPNEFACQSALEQFLKAEHLSTELIEMDASLCQVEGFHDDGLPLDQRPNLLAFFGEKLPAAKTLILNAHIDTVEWESQLHAWDQHPLSPCQNDGRLYGRGAVDDKGQIIMAAMAILALSDLGYTPPGEAILQSVIGEEPSGNGTLALCSHGVRADAAVNLEPTENHIHYGHRGVVAWRCRLEGEAKHGSVVKNPVNSIAAMGELAGMLNAQLDSWSAGEDTVYGVPRTNIGTISGGTDVFTTPTTCQMEFAVRYAPGTYEKILAVTEKTIDLFRDSLASENLTFQSQLYLHHDASAIDPQSPFVQMLQQCLNATGEDGLLRTFPGGADARHFNNRYHIPALLFGAGSLEQAHAVNEYLPLDQWERGAIALALLIRDWCI